MAIAHLNNSDGQQYTVNYFTIIQACENRACGHKLHPVTKQYISGVELTIYTLQHSLGSQVNIYYVLQRSWQQT